MRANIANMMSIFSFIILLAAIIYLGILGYLYFFQRSILYKPEHHMENPAHYGLENVEQLQLKTADNITITAWYSPPPSPEAPVIAYFHGNAGTLADRSEKLSLLIKQGAGVMALSYRGYAGGEGSPSEQGLYEDARTVIHYLLNHNIPVEKIALYGESLGTGVAVQMATEFKVKALILEAPYTSIARKAGELYPYIPVNLLLKDHFNNISKITQIHCPILVMHGEKDQTIPVTHGKTLYAAATGKKELHLYPDTGHADFNLHEITQVTTTFVMNHLHN